MAKNFPDFYLCHMVDFSKKYLMLALLLSLLCAPAQAAVVTAFFKNAAPGDRVEVYVPHFYLDGKSSSFQGMLDGQLQCHLEVSMPKAQVAFVIFADDRLPVFLEPDDTLLVRSDAFQFPLLVQFGGRGGANNALLQQYFRESPHDWNEFNNLRFKVGQYWATMEEPLNLLMEDLPVDSFRRYADTRRNAATALHETFAQDHPNALTADFEDWLMADVLYSWAYALLFYGQVYGSRHFVQPEYFEFLYEAPTISDQTGCDAYRQFIMLLLARQQIKQGKSTDNFYAGQYTLAGELLDAESLAFVRSELISFGFWGERYREMLPCYNDFVQHNPYPAYGEKVQGLYSRLSRVAPGSDAPSFEAPDLHGQRLALEQLHGKVVYLNFWASWCAACISKMQLLDPYIADLYSHGIEVVNVSIDDNPANWQSSIARYQFQGKHLRSTEAANVAATYQVEAIPQYFIIGRDGRFVEKATTNQPEDIRQRLLQVK